jgi:hypothetical protein
VLAYGGNMLARALVHDLLGLDPRSAAVEAPVRMGVPALAVVGLADRARWEAKERGRRGIASADPERRPRRITEPVVG